MRLNFVSKQRKLSASVALLPVCISVVWSSAVLAAPVGTLPGTALARTVGVGQEPAEAKALLDEARGKAQDLEYRPPLWNWTTPVTVQRVGQATTPPAGSTAQAAPDAADDVGDILDEVSVTATRRARRERDTTATTYAIKKEDFQAQGAQNVTDALQLVPGFIGQPSLGGQRSAGGNFLRGFNDQRFTTLRDGVPLTYPQNGRSSIQQITVDDLERVEVVTGGATLRYGSGSVGGVINLITETPKGPPKFTLQYEVGSYGFSKYLAKYGGGDDTFSYNFVFSSLVAFNNFPFKYNLPGSAQFYGPTTNPNSTLPPALPRTSASASYYPNRNSSGAINSFGLPGADPANNGAIDLFGFLKPEVGPPITVSGVQDASYNAGDSYTAKFAFKPDPYNRISLRAGQRNNYYGDQGPGVNAANACFGGFSLQPNGTLSGNRFTAVNPDGSEAGCTEPYFQVQTPSTRLASVANFNRSYNGQTLYPTGQPFLGGVEIATASSQRYQRRVSAQTEISLFHDLDLTPTTSINSYANFYRNIFNNFRPDPYLINTTQRGLGPATASFNAIPAGLPAQPFSDGTRLELQTALNTKLSPGQDLSFGLNYSEDRVYQQQLSGTGRSTFFDNDITRYSFFLIDDISFSDQLKANIGLRYTSSSQFGEVLTPAAGVRYTPNNFISFRSNWSQVFNAPNLGDLYLVGGVFVDNPRLQPETGVTYDVGVDITPARNLGIRLTYFSTYINGVFGNLIFVNPNLNNPASPTFGEPLIQQVNNLAGRRATGIEFSADWRVTDQIQLRAIWTNTDARDIGRTDNINDSAFPFNYEYQLLGIPFNNVVLAATYLNKGLLVSLLGRYDSGKRRGGTNLFVPAWATLDLNVELPVTPFLTVTGNVFNLTDTQYEYVSNSPAPGTTFRVGARLEFGG